MKKNEAKTGRKCDYCPSNDASPLTLKNFTVVSSCESCYESGAFKNKPTHTPGPWTLSGLPENGDYELMGGNAVDGFWRKPVAVLRGVDQPSARLIAAAPDLLAALTALMAEIDSDETSGRKLRGLSPEMSRARIAARIAIRSVTEAR